MKDKYVLKLKDGGVKDIRYDTEHYGGCPTCDYGSSYINEIYFYLETGILTIRVSQMYDYPLSEGFMMKLLLNNVDQVKEKTEQEFIEWLENEINAEFEDDDIKIKIDFCEE